MQLRRLQPYLLTLALVLLVVPLQAHAAEWWDVIGNIGQSFADAIQYIAYMIVINAFGLLVWFSANLLNFAVNAFVIGFGNTFTTTGIGVAVDQTWVIIRDFVNMFFIFGFVYIGFKMILNSSDSNTRRWLVNILLAALLVNFSLFITKFTIDISNQLAAQIAVNGLTDGTEIYRGEGENRIRQVDIGASFMARMGIASVMGMDHEAVKSAGWGYIFGVAIMFLTTAFVFAAGGILLIIRFAMLNIFMILSPAMFMSWILPSLKDTMQRFWSQFIGKALFAPIYLLFIYFSLQVISGLQTSIGEGGSFSKPDWAGTFSAIKSDNGTGSANSGDMGTLPFFFLICIFLALSLIVADKLGMEGGAKAVSLGRSAINRVRREAVKQTGGRIVRASGAVASSAENHLNRRLGTMAQGGGASRAAARFLDRTAGAGLRGAQSASMGGGESYNARNKRVGEQNVRLNQLDSDSKREERRLAAEKALLEADKQVNTVTNDPASTAAQKKAAEDAKKAAEATMAAAIKEMSIDEVLDMASNKKGNVTLNSAMYSKYLSDAQIKAIQESGVYINSDEKKLKESRENATFSDTEKILNDVTTTASDLNSVLETLSKTVRGLSEERLQNTKIERLTDLRFASHLSEPQVESLEKSGKFSAQQIQEIKDARSKGIIGRIDGSILPNNPNASSSTFRDKQREQILSGNAQDVGKLPVGVFKNPDIVEHLTPAMVEQRMKSGISKSDLQDIKFNIESYITNPTTSASTTAMWVKWQDNTTYGAQFFNV